MPHSIGGTPSEAVQLINSLIEGTQVQRDLIWFKSKYSHGSTGKVGVGYWTAFKKRNKDKIRSKKGKRFELNRSNWSTYRNFNQMYDQVYEHMVDAGLAVKLLSPKWMNKEGVEAGKEESFGCMVTHNLLYPEMCIVMDEVGGNTSQKGDGLKGGQLIICGKETIPQIKASTNDKHFTLLGLTALNGDPVMCVLIIEGKRESRLQECGMDIFAQKIGEMTDDNFFEQSQGPGKRFPGGPTCVFQGKDIPCMVRFTQSGSITSAVLRDILVSLDEIGVFDCAGGLRRPFILLDGHGSRLELPFLSYINDEKHPWVACIGVPYGTALWQVGDSSEQNGSYMMALGEYKEKLIAMKEKHELPLTISPHKIIPMVNHAWAHSFARCIQNKKAIADRGWNPLNRVLLTDDSIRRTMTEQELSLETLEYHIPPSSTEIVPYAPPLPAIVPYTSTTITAPPPDAVEPLNFSQGKAASVLDTLVQHNDLMEARQRMKVRRDNGKNLKEQLMEGERITAGRCFKAGTVRLGQTVFECVRENKLKQMAIAREKADKADAQMKKKREAATAVRALGKPNSALTSHQLRALLAPLKRKTDKALPSRHAELLTRLTEWERRDGLAVERGCEDVLDGVAEDEAIESDCEGDDFEEMTLTPNYISTEPEEPQTEEV